ncbi:hypothetical protein ABPG75_009823 [Micractinium tetrahymenae]
MLRFAFLDCEDAEKWRGHEEMAHSILQPGASWEHYRCFNRELPPLEGLADRFDGLLISGSHYSAYGQQQWIHQLEEWLQQAVAQHPQVRIIGMCFGCQILAKALGGRVGKNADGRFVLGVETIQLKPALQQCAAFIQAVQDVAAVPGAGATAGSGTACPSSVRLIESHGDCVLALPAAAILLAESSSAPVEMWTVPGGNVLGVQGHAELSAADTLEKILGAITAAGRLSADEAKKAERSLRKDKDDAQLVLCFYRHFMARGLPEVAAAAGSSAPGGSAAAGVPAAEPGARAANDGAELPVSTAARVAAEQAGSARSEAASSPSSPRAAGTSTAAAAAHLVEQLRLAVGAELSKPVAEQQLLRQCNEAAAGRYQHLAEAAASARGRLQDLPAQQQQQQQHDGHASTCLLDGLGLQVQALEASVAQLDKASRRLQARLDFAGDGSAL